MGSRRLILALVAAVVALSAATQPVNAKKPAPQPDPPSGQERPLTQEESAAADRKAADAERYVASAEASGADLAALACVVPTGATEAEIGTTAESAALAPGSGPVATTGCVVPQYFLAVEARDQANGIYCAPAVGQVIANYTWGMPSGVNKYTQNTLAGWMNTVANGGTNATWLEAGLETATAGAPRRPAGWTWVVAYLTDTDRDGTTGDQLHAYVRSNISGSKMPLAIPVKPHDPNSLYYLSSWPRAVSSPGHWIAAYGWVGSWDGTSSSRLYFTDSSRDEGGATGKFWTPFRTVAKLIGEHTGRLVW